MVGRGEVGWEDREREDSVIVGCVLGRVGQGLKE